MTSFDTLIIGAGPGGIAAAKRLGRTGKTVALVSQDLGGECLNWGCIPTKTYLWTAELLEKIAQGEDFGIDFSEAPRVNWARMKERKDEVVKKLKKNLAWSLEQAKVTVIDGTARLKSPNTVEVTLGTEVTGTESQEIQAEHIILATGSEPVFPEGFIQKDASPRLGLGENILSNREILSLPEIPKTLLIVGSGAVGVEFASVFAALGTQVTLAERSPSLLPAADHEVSQELERVFFRKNIRILKGTTVTPEQTHEYEKTLMAVGRRPKTENLGLAEAGVQLEKSRLSINESYQTNIPNIYAIGDLAGKCFLAYSAEREGEIAADHILGKNTAPLDYNTVPNTIFSLPEIAWVGETEASLKQKGVAYTVGKSPYSANAKALIIGGRDGFAKVLARADNGEILGIHIIGEKASELIGEASLIVAAKMTLETVKNKLYSHPVLGEVLKEALEIRS